MKKGENNMKNVLNSREFWSIRDLLKQFQEWGDKVELISVLKEYDKSVGRDFYLAVYKCLTNG